MSSTNTSQQTRQALACLINIRTQSGEALVSIIRTQSGEALVSITRTQSGEALVISRLVYHKPIQCQQFQFTSYGCGIWQTIADVMELYIEELGFDRKTARAQVQAHVNMSGYFTTYYYGYKKVADWEKLYGFDKREYNELLFSAGRVSLETFERYLKLSEADRYSLTHEFASLAKFR